MRGTYAGVALVGFSSDPKLGAPHVDSRTEQEPEHMGTIRLRGHTACANLSVLQCKSLALVVETRMQNTAGLTVMEFMNRLRGSDAKSSIRSVCVIAQRCVIHGGDFRVHENDIIDYWTEVALYDLETASAMLESKRFLYVGFMCHQAIEKILKAMYVKRRHADPPRTHNLLLLSRACGAYQDLSEEQLQLMDLLEPLNIEARYPTDKAKLLENLTAHRCETFLKETTELYQWIKQKLSNG